MQSDEIKNVQPLLQQHNVSGSCRLIINVYGIDMSVMQEIRFSKYLSNNSIAMNTKTKQERKEIAEKWLQNNCSG